MRLLQNITNNRFFHPTIYFLLVFLICGMLTAYIIYAYKILFNVDASYYLGITEQIYKGNVPIKDFALGYTPLSFFLMLIPRALMGATPEYTVYLFANYLFSFFSALLLGLIIKQLTSNKILTLLGIFLYLLFNFFLEGVYFVLEPFANTFGLMSVYLIIKYSSNLRLIFFSGLLAGFSFLSKQYGLIYLGCLGLLLLVEDNISINNRIKKVGMLLLGFVSSLAIVSVYFEINDVALKDVIVSLSGSGYGERTFSKYVSGLKDLISMFPFVLLTPFIIISEKRKKLRVILLVFFITLFVASWQFLFQTYLHYSIFLLPFFLIIILVGLNNKSSVITFLVAIFLAYSGMIYSNRVLKRTQNVAKSETRVNTILKSKKMKEVLLNYSPRSMYPLDVESIPYYFYLNLKPSQMKEYGYSFGFESKDQIYSRTKNADLVLVSKGYYPKVNEQIKVLLTNEFELEQIDDFNLFLRKPDLMR